MKQCNQYDDAFHYDCVICTETNCKFNRANDSFGLWWLVLALELTAIILLVIVS